MVIGVIDNWVDLWNATEPELISRLQITFARVSSYSAIRRVMINLDYEELQVVFNQWSNQSGRCPFHQDARFTKMSIPPTGLNSF
ncbi:hypothetical protein [Moorena producens]|uniref:hypothetical protein n=1 Tax=Moorena producens TaxID=1155739 RepID=UPI003C75CAD5